MLKYSILIICILFGSCCGLRSVVIYRYDDIVVTRVDECGKTSFFYGDESNQATGKIWVEYSGINDGFSGYLKFNKNGKVTLLSGDGYFRNEKLDTTKFEYKRILAHERPMLDGSVCVISFATEIEKKQNKIARTQVNAEYHIDENEWW